METAREFGRDRKDLGCWSCKKPIPDENADCPLCWWRTCACGACRQPWHVDARGRIGPCSEEVARLGLLLRNWPTTFDGISIPWPSPAELSAGPAVKQWVQAMSKSLDLPLQILESRGFHSGFGLRLGIPRHVDFHTDSRLPVLIQSAANLTATRGVIVEHSDDDRLTFVPGEGVFLKQGVLQYENPLLKDAAAFEELELAGAPLGLALRSQ